MTTRYGDRILRNIRRAAVAVALLAAACATSGPASNVGYEADAASRVFAKAYENVVNKYIEPLEPSNFVVAGMGGLAELDPDFHATMNDGAVLVTHGGTALARLPPPANDNFTGWARLTSKAIDAGRERSAVLRAASPEDLYRAVLNRALSKLDRHSRYAGVRSARDYRARREGFGGIGVRLNFEHGLPQVISVLPDTPAERNRIEAGDVLVEVDGAPLEGLDRNAVIWRLRGDVGSEAVLLVSRKGHPAPLTITLRRALIVSQTVHIKREGPLAVISLTGFNQRTARNLNRVLGELNTAKMPGITGIILDMRGNPGGLLDQAVAVADSFLGRGRIVSTRGRHPDSFQMFNASGRDLANGLPLVVLINGQSASAAEIVAAALQDQGRAVVVGSNSYGKGTVQNITRLPNDGELILTWSRFHAPSGYALENLGIMPNFCTSRLAEGTAASLDAQAMRGAIVLTAWRTHSGYDAKSARAMRARCPGVAEKPGQDIAIAAVVMANKGLYARAVGASVPSVASSPGSGTAAR